MRVRLPPESHSFGCAKTACTLISDSFTCMQAYTLTCSTVLSPMFSRWSWRTATAPASPDQTPTRMEHPGTPPRSGPGRASPSPSRRLSLVPSPDRRSAAAGVLATQAPEYLSPEALLELQGLTSSPFSVLPPLSPSPTSARSPVGPQTQPPARLTFQNASRAEEQDSQEPPAELSSQRSSGSLQHRQSSASHHSEALSEGQLELFRQRLSADIGTAPVPHTATSAPSLDVLPCTEIHYCTYVRLHITSEPNMPSAMSTRRRSDTTVQ